jgi:frataxin-like iron-binding protein CyaY
MNKQEFHKIADDLLEGFAVKIEEQLEDLVEDMDVSYSVRQLCEAT